MKHRIEIINLAPNMSPQGQIGTGLVLSYKKNGQIESIQLDGSHKQIMDEFKVENLSDIPGKKFDVDMETKDGKCRMTNISVVDERTISYSDFTRLEAKLNETFNMLKRHIGGEKVGE